jgi:hypothetical protein
LGSVNVGFGDEQTFTGHTAEGISTHGSLVV